VASVLATSGFVLAPTIVSMNAEILLAVLFVAWLSLRLIGAFVGAPPAQRSVEMLDRELPTYTIIAALYREANSVDGLLRAIERLDYPREKLDVLIVVEADDRETRAALAARKTSLPLTVIPVPAIGPRTKPKALNVALPFARGALTVVYDAEDRPQPDQLRCAIRAFRTGGDDLACVQARLCIDNGVDSWLARFFAAEYASQFDVFLPGVAALRLPLPLGGSSNHFYTAVLRETGGWDPYNVTEDADLGMRLARFGYRTGVIDSTTYEEAPAHFGPWLRQRTRWFKGWMQCWLVHMRKPLRLLRDLGLAGFLAFQLVVGGNVLAALVHPLFIAALIYAAVGGMPVWHGDDLVFGMIAAFYGAIAVVGYVTSAFLGWLGLSRRGLLGHAWILLLTPVHWLMLSLAAWRAFYQLMASPYLWEKTEHGLAKSSLRAANVTRSLVELERHLTALKAAGELPELPDVQPESRPLAPSHARAAA
jgi:cellulose synthase/poly-beta-1,6-N-acetylglucosamine synthase-like glycosyltransferase